MMAKKIDRGEPVNLADPSTWDIPLFPVAMVANASAISPDQLRQWIVRGRVTLWDEIEGFQAGARAAGEGLGHLLTFRQALHIAVTGRLAVADAEVSKAFQATMRWTHMGDMDKPGFWVGEPEPKMVRAPAALFGAPAMTFLIYNGDSARIVAVVPENGNLPFKGSDLYSRGHPLYMPPRIVHLNQLVAHVQAACQGFLRK